LCAPTDEAPTPAAAQTERCGEGTAMMPLRTTSRAQNRAVRIATERPTTAKPDWSPKPHKTGPAPPDDDPQLFYRLAWARSGTGNLRCEYQPAR
jgi:hypothetical protein